MEIKRDWLLTQLEALEHVKDQAQKQYEQAMGAQKAFQSVLTKLDAEEEKETKDGD